MNFKNLFLPYGIVIAVIIAMIVPDAGSKLNEVGVIPIFIFIIFLINGVQFKFSEILFNKKLFFAFLLTFLISFIISPLLAFGFVKCISFPTGCALGLLVMSTVPPTLSSAIVVTEQSGGNTAWSILLTISMNLLGVLLIPFVLGTLLNTGIDFQIDPLPLLNKLILLVFIPFFIGLFTKYIFGFSKLKNMMKWLSYIPSTCVILTVYVSLAISRETLLGTPLYLVPIIIVSVIFIHLFLFFIALSGSKFIKLKSPETKAIVFVSSQKTLPVAISVLAVLNDHTGQALVVCLFFHFSQLMIDSGIAGKMK